jgi:hypothetical protein
MIGHVARADGSKYFEGYTYTRIDRIVSSEKILVLPNPFLFMLVTHQLRIVLLIFKTTITEMERLGLQRFWVPH